MSYQAIGMIVGLILGGLITALILKMANTNNMVKTEYDERQQLIRGKAYKIAFWTLSGGLICVSIADMAFPNMHITNYIVLTALFFVALSVMCLYCIINGCYWGLNNNKKTYMIIFWIAGLLNLFNSVMAIIGGYMVVNGELQFPFIGLMCTLFIAIVAGTALICDGRDKNDSDESED